VRLTEVPPLLRELKSEVVTVANVPVVPVIETLTPVVPDWSTLTLPLLTIAVEVVWATTF
jgi:hypothetical protein